MRLAGYDHLLAAGRRLQWDATAIDLSADVLGDGASPARRLVAGFCVAERAVAEHLAPFVPRAGGEVAERCFALQASDEARHAAFFTRVAREVCALGAEDEAALAGEPIVALFQTELPRAARALAAGEAALSDAVALYHLVLEGIVFSIGQQALLDELDALGTMPGTREGTARVQADERWHVGLGVLSLQRAGATVDVGELAARASRAWGADVATPARVEHALATHARRLSAVQ